MGSAEWRELLIHGTSSYKSQSVIPSDQQEPLRSVEPYEIPLIREVQEVVADVPVVRSGLM